MQDAGFTCTDAKLFKVCVFHTYTALKAKVPASVWVDQQDKASLAMLAEVMAHFFGPSIVKNQQMNNYGQSFYYIHYAVVEGNLVDLTQIFTLLMLFLLYYISKRDTFTSLTSIWLLLTQVNYYY